MSTFVLAPRRADDARVCDNCRFFAEYQHARIELYPAGHERRHESEGQCRINPPARTADIADHRWPTVFGSDWCGRFDREPR